MLKKVLNMIKNAKGFTLVELLAVIVILGIIAAIAVPAVGGIISNTQDRANEAEKTVVIEAARTAYTVNGETFTVGDDSDDEITVAELIAQGYLNDTDSSLDDEATVSVSDGTFTYNEPEE